MAFARQHLGPGLEDIIRRIRLLGQKIADCKCSEDVDHYKAEIEILAACEEVKHSDIARHLVYNYLWLASARWGELRFAEAKAGFEVTANQVNSYAIDMPREPLAAMLKNNGLWSEQELKRFVSIDPAGQYTIALFDDSGKICGVNDVSGQRLRDSAALVKAYAEQDRLPPGSDALREFNIMLYGNSHGHEGDTGKIVQGLDKVEKAAMDVLGDTAVRAPDKRAAIQEDAKKVIDKVDNLKRLHKEKGCQPGMEKVTDKIIEDEDEELRKLLKPVTKKWAESSPDSQDGKKAGKEEAPHEKTLQQGKMPPQAKPPGISLH